MAVSRKPRYQVRSGELIDQEHLEGDARDQKILVAVADDLNRETEDLLDHQAPF